MFPLSPVLKDACDLLEQLHPIKMAQEASALNILSLFSVLILDYLCLAISMITYTSLFSKFSQFIQLNFPNEQSLFVTSKKTFASNDRRRMSPRLITMYS